MAEQSGKINMYRCINKHEIITINKDEGTTPMFITCEKCQKQMQSKFYMVDQTLVPTHEWYKPHEEECKADAISFAKQHNIDSENVVAGFLEHLTKGGLFLRLIKR